jgi:hypothetical protein
MIKFKSDTELAIVESFEEANDIIAEQGAEVFKAGELVDAEIVGDMGMFVDLQFPDGSLALGVQRDCFVEFRTHIFSPHTDLCKFCGCHATDDAIANEPCLEVVAEHVFSTSTGLCVKCGAVAEDNLVENNPCK